MKGLGEKWVDGRRMDEGICDFMGGCIYGWLRGWCIYEWVDEDVRIIVLNVYWFSLYDFFI